jgi:hypothetical protein
LRSAVAMSRTRRNRNRRPKSSSGLGLALHVSEGGTDEEAGEEHEVVVVTDPCEVAESVACVDCMPHQTEAGANRLCPEKPGSRTACRRGPRSDATLGAPPGPGRVCRN